MEKALDKVKEFIDKGYPHWAYPIASELQKQDNSLAIQWIANCLRIRIKQSPSPHFTKLEDYIQQALDSQNLLTCLEYYEEMARKIWYSPDREEIQTAVSRLWWAIGLLKEGRDYHHRAIQETSAAINLALGDENNIELRNQFIEEATKIYDRYKSQKQS